MQPTYSIAELVIRQKRRDYRFLIILTCLFLFVFFSLTLCWGKLDMA